MKTKKNKYLVVVTCVAAIHCEDFESRATETIAVEAKDSIEAAELAEQQSELGEGMHAVACFKAAELRTWADELDGGHHD